MANATLFNPSLRSWTHSTEQFPLLGVNVPDIQMAAGRVRFAGITGTVATAYGIRRMGATRMATGLYRVQVPKAVDFQVWVQNVVPTGVGTLVPTGVGYTTTVSNKQVQSGTFDLFFTLGVPTGVGGPAAPTGTAIAVNPPPNAEISMLFWVESLVRY